MEETCPVCRAPVAPGEAVCASCGFKLLGTTQRFEPIDLAGDGPAPAAPAPAAAALTVLRGSQAGASYALGDEPVTIGRSPQCTVFLNDMTVSRSHAVVEREGDAYVIRDDNSFNGVWINNANVEAKVLAPGDLIQIGSFCLRYDEG
ncbi:MAG: FHA domain-containing protein [Eggerthellaceae bacterium]|nr:FHA domain-containing protein [Eggerthellaceae bacterium]